MAQVRKCDYFAGSLYKHCVDILKLLEAEYISAVEWGEHFVSLQSDY